MPVPAVAGRSVAEIVRQVRRIQIVANRLVDDLFAGAYHSAFRGRGMEFDEVREYLPGDEVRTIDWNVTARQGSPFVKRHKEERELTVVFLVDTSASGAFGSASQSKLERIVEVTALLMFAAMRNNDKVGLALFADGVTRYLAPRKGKGSVLRLLRELVAVEPVARTTRVDEALAFLMRVQKRRAVVFLVSDLLGEKWSRELAIANRRHDVVAITVSDPREHELPDAGLLTLRDAETGALRLVDTGSRRVRDAFRLAAVAREAAIGERLRRAGVDRLALSTAEDYTRTLQRFFRMRERRLSR